MMRWWPARSLYWTIAGSFLLVLLVVTVLQWLAVVWLVEPAAQRWRDARLSLAAQRAATEIGLTLERDPAAEIAPLLRTRGDPRSRWMLLYADGDRMVGARPLPPRFRRRLAILLEEGADPGDRRPRGRSAPYDEPPRPDRGPPARRGGPFRGGAPGSIEIAGRHTVRGGGIERGEVVALRPAWRLRILPVATPRPLLLFVPGAILVAGMAALLIFRPLLLRIRRLEEQAERVGRGELDARIDHPGDDELGRLAERMNRMTERLGAARAQLETADRQRRQLLGDISHELATPLTTIRGYAETLLDPQVVIDDEERPRFLADVLAEAERMDLLVQDLLDLARLESGNLELEPERIDWIALLRHTLDRYAERFTQAGLELRPLRAGPEEAFIEADGRRLEQLVENLLSNALRYVPAGGAVELALQSVPTGDPGPPSAYKLQVRDDGPGFAEADLPYVFDRFYRADHARSTSGTGLGLAIVREIARQHGGQVRAGNRSPHGAVLEVELPAAANSTAS